MTHGLAQFRAADIAEKARGVLDLLDRNEIGDAAIDAIHEGLRVTLENQVKIAETLDLIKQEFDKFEAGLDKIL